MNKILIVDDQERDLYLLKTLLGGHGYEVMEAVNGVEALALARTNPPDVIISDILMPVMDGFSLCREWKKDEELRDIPFVFYTATYTDPKDEELALSLGAARFIPKPVEIEEFVSILEQVIAEVKSGKWIALPASEHGELTYYRMYNQALISKLEDKMLQLEKVNRALRQEIAERKQTEEQLFQSEESFSKAFRSSPTALMITRLADGKYVEVNEAYLDIVGFDRTELIGHLTTEFNIYIYPEQRQEILYQLLEDGKLYNYEATIRHKSGELRTVVASLEQIHFRGEDCILSTLFDITERNHAEEKLRQSENRYRLATKATNDVIWEWDLLTDRLQWNENAQAVFGYAPEDISPHESWWEGHLHPQDRERVLANRNDVIASGESIWKDEYRFLSNDGSFLHIVDRGYIERDEGGRPLRMIGAMSDLTQRRRAEEILRESQEQYRSLFEDSPISLWLEDFSEVKRRLDQLKENGIVDLAAYLREHPKFVIECVQSVRVLEVNSATLKLYHAREKSQLLGSLSQMLPHLPPDQFEYELIHIANRQFNFEREAIDQTLTGESIYVNSRWSVAPGYEDTLAKVIVSTVDITERRRAQEQIQRQLKQLNSLRTIDMAISSSFDLHIILDIILQQALSQLGADAGAVLLINLQTQMVEYAASRGLGSYALRNANLKLEGYASQVVLERKIIRISDVTGAGGKIIKALRAANESFKEYYGIPLIVKGEIKGVLEIYHRTSLQTDPEWREFLETLAGQAAIAIDNVQLFNSLRHSNLELGLAYDATIEGWSKAMDLRDKETEGHTQRVTELTLKLASAMNIPQSELLHIRRGALLHDMGKLGVPDHILLKSGELTKEEWDVMRQHPRFAYEMLVEIYYLKPALDIPYCHHEKWDGSGYPRGLQGEEIPLAARIFAVVDVWDALTSDRPYRDAWSQEQALEYIKEQSGRHFDPRVVQAFLILIAND